MAEVLKEWPKGVSAKGGRFWKYMDGQVWRVSLAETGRKNRNSLSSALNYASRAAGVKLRTTMDKDGKHLIIQAYKPDNNA